MSDTLQHILIAIGGALNLAILIGVVWVGWASYKSKLAKQGQEELQKLVDIRGEHIETLESRISTLEAEVHALRGEVRALREFKSEDIADKVVEKIIPFLVGDTTIS